MTADHAPTSSPVFVISGPGGVGKGTLVERLRALDPTLWVSRSWTTRAPRPGESPDSYHFVDTATFTERVERDGFLEWAEYLGNLYGTPVPEPPDAVSVILEIEVQGAAQVLSRVPDAVMILVVPPSREVQAQRLRSRGDPEQRVQERLTKAAEEEAAGRALAHHVVVNDDLDRAVAEVAGILARYRSARERS